MLLALSYAVPTVLSVRTRWKEHAERCSSSFLADSKARQALRPLSSGWMSSKATREWGFDVGTSRRIQEQRPGVSPCVRSPADTFFRPMEALMLLDVEILQVALGFSNGGSMIARRGPAARGPPGFFTMASIATVSKRDFTVLWASSSLRRHDLSIRAGGCAASSIIFFQDGCRQRVVAAPFRRRR